MQPMDPMNQYDPATAALIAKQTMPHAPTGMVPQASPLDSIAKVAQQMMMQQAGKRGQPAPQPNGYDPVMGRGASMGSPNQAASLNYLNPDSFYGPGG